MAKWFSFVAFLIAAGAAYLLFESQGLVETLQKKGAEWKDKWTATDGQLTKTKGELDTTKASLKAKTEEQEKTAADLATAKADAEKANGDLKSIKDGLVAAGIPVEDLSKGINSLKENIAKLTADAKAAEEKIAAANKEKDEAVAKATEAEKKSAEQKLVIDGLTSDKEKLTADNDTKGKQIRKYKDSIMEKGIRGRVLAVNSGWGFAVVSIGDKQGAASNKTLVVARGGQAIGKLKISNVENNQSIADIVPNSFVSGTYVQPGDDVIYTGDEKVKIDDAAPAGAGSVVPPLPIK